MTKNITEMLNVKGERHTIWNWACFVHYLKIINTFFLNNMIILKQKSGKLKNDIQF